MASWTLRRLSSIRLAAFRSFALFAIWVRNWESPMRIENYGGTGILLSAVTHLAQTLPVRYVFGLYDYVSPELPLVRNPLEVCGGRISVPVEAGPGLGVDVDEIAAGQTYRGAKLALFTHNSGQP
jgi:L-alanine-DL-glutamate epimerase-like enolase superfamily enzyme